MAKTSMRSRAEYLKDLAKLHKNETPEERARRLRRNERVAKRRKKARAAARRGRRQHKAVHAASAPIPAVVAASGMSPGARMTLVVGEDSVTVYRSGRFVHSWTNIEVEVKPFVEGMQYLAEAFGAQFKVTDLRDPK